MKRGIFIFILLLAIFLRFSRATDLFVFSGDEEHQLSIAQTITDNFHLEWVGVSSADTEFYLGPFWEYFGAFWLWLSRGDPALLAYAAAAIGVATTILVYLAGRFLFSETIGLVAGFLYATLPLLVYYDRKFWNPALTSFTALALFFSLAQTKKSAKWWILVAFLYGLVFHVHLSLVPLGLVIAYWFFKKGYRISRKLFLLCAAGFLITISPLVGFDYFHDFSNLKTPIRMIASARAQPGKFNLAANFEQLSASLGRVWYLSPFRSNADEVLHSCYRGLTTTASRNFFSLSLFSFGLLIWFLARRQTWKNQNLQLLALFLITILVSFLFLPNVPLEYYLLGFFPLFFYLPALVFDLLTGWSKIGFLALLLTLSFLGILTVLTATGEYGLTAKRRLIEKVSEVVGEGKFELAAEGECHKYEGWRFLFKAYGKLPERAYSDVNFGWLYPKEISSVPVDFRVLVGEARVPGSIPEGYQTVVSEGGFKAYVYAVK